MMRLNYKNIDNFLGLGYQCQNRLLYELAVHKFNSARNRGRVSRLIKFLTRRPTKLNPPAEIQTLFARRRHPQNITPVAIHRIRGGMHPNNAFDIAFAPRLPGTQRRWINIAVEMLKGKVLPPVELARVDNVYYVRRGYYRISVARALGQTAIDADVTIMKSNAAAVCLPEKTTSCQAAANPYVFKTATAPI